MKRSRFIITSTSDRRKEKVKTRKMIHSGAERDIRCNCGHIRYAHIGDAGRCMACDCTEFTDEKEALTIYDDKEPNGAD